MATNPLPNERELLAKIAEGDELAFKKVYDAYFSNTYNFAYHVLHSKELSEEVVQEVMLKLWQMGPDVIHIQDLGGFLNKLGTRRAIDVLRRIQYIRKAEREARADWSEANHDTEQTILLNETKKILEEGILLLPHQQRMVYQLCHQQGLKHEEAATQMNIAPGTVHRHMKMALKFLRLYLQQRTEVTILLIIFKLM